MIPSQMLKGILEGCILSIISIHDSYGYEISEMLCKYGFGNISEGTIYPILLRLQRNKAIESYFKKSDQGPNRKYYRLTEEGRKSLIEFNQSFKELQNAINNLLNNGGDEDNE